MATRRDVLQIKLEVQGDGTVKASLAEVGKQAEQTGKQVQGAAGGMRMLGEAIAAFGVAKVVEGFIRINREAEQLRVSLKTLEGSQSVATERFRELQDMARTTPLSVNQVTEAYIKLKNFGLEPMDGTMQAIIDTGAALGGGFETINGLIMAFGQANAKGKLQGEEMLQMAERGVPVYDTLARALGKTTGEIQEMASKGQLGRDTIKLLADELGKANFGAAAAQADTLDGAIGALLDNIEQLAIALGDSGLRQVLTILITQVGEGVQALTDMIGPVQDVGNEAGAASKLMQGLSTAVLVVTSGAKVAGAGVGVMVDYLLALVDAAKAAMTAVTGYYTAVWQVMQGDFSGARDTVAQSLENSAAAFERAQARVANAHQTFGEVYDDIAMQLGDDLDKLKAAASGAADEVGKAGKAAAAAATPTAVLSDAVKKARTEAERLIAALEKQIATHGKSETQILREEAARLKGMSATRLHGEALDRLITTYERLQKQDEAVLKTMELVEEQERENAAAIEAYNRLLEEQMSAFGGPLVDAALKYAAALEVIKQAEIALAAQGPLSTEQLAALAQARDRALQDYVKSVEQGNIAIRNAAIAQVQGFGRVWLQGMQDLAPALTDAIMSGEWEDVGKRLAESIVAGLIDTLMHEAITKPLQDAFMSAMGGEDGRGGFSFGQFFDSLRQGRSGSAGEGGGGWNMTRLGTALAGGMMAYQGHQSGSWLQGAAGGAMAGSTFGPWGMAIGALVGALGGVFGGEKDPYLTVGGVGRTRDPRTTFTTNFGSQQIGVRGGMPMEDFISRIQQFDQTIASLIRSVGGGATEIEAITRALSGWSADLRGGAASMENLLNQRLDVIIQAAEPTWARFLSQIAGVQERVEAFTALYAIRDMIDELDTAAETLAGGPLVQLRAELTNLTKGVDDSLAALQTALEGQNPAEVEQAAIAAQQAVIARYNAEIEMVRSLETALLTAQQQARSLDLQLAQRIAGLSGDWSGAADTARTGMITTQALVMGTTDPERALAFLDEFISHVEAWLQSSINQVNALAAAEQNRINTALAGIAAQQQALQAQMAVLLDERNSIIAEATARSQAAAQAAQAQAQAIAQAQQAAAQAQIEALQEQLDIAQQFARVMADAQAMIERMTFSSSNPLGAQARLALMDQEIAAAEAAMAGSTGADQAAAAARILDLLNQRLQLVQSEGLMQRPGEDYLALYNDTLQRIAGVQAIAEPEADLALQLQEELNRIQSRTFDAISSIGSTVTYTAAEQARLAAIAEEEARIQAELERLEAEALELQAESIEIQRRAEEQIATLQREAQAQYEWARGEAARLQAERAQALQSQIDVITGGRPIDEFIAQRQAESVGLLTNIRDDLRNFLDAISGNAASPGTGTMPGTGPGQGGTPKPPGDDHQQPLPNLPTVHMPTTLHITVASGDPQQIAAAVTTALDTQMPQIATRLKRELDTA